MKLNFYISRKFLWSLLYVSAFVMSVVYLIDMVDYFGRFSQVGVTFSQVIFFTLARIPENYFQFLPLIILLAALFCFFSLARHSEIVAIRAAGIPAVKFVFIPAFLSFFIGILFVTVLNPALVYTHSFVENARVKFVGEINGEFSQNGTWLRENSGEQTTLYRLQKYDREDDEARGVTIYQIDENKNITQIHAKGLQFEENNWQLKNVTTLDFDDTENVKFQKSVTIPSSKNTDLFFETQISPKRVQNRDLPSYINSLEKDGYDSKSAKSYFYQQMSFPLFLLTLCLIGSIFALAPPRFGGISQRTILTLLIGFATYSATMLTYSMGQAGQLPMLLSVLVIPVPALFVAFTFLLREEDG